MSKNVVAVRSARPDDCEAMHQMLVALAVYERAPDAVKVTPAELRRDGFGPNPRYEAIIAEHDARPVGFALWTSNYSTWEGRAGFFLEDIFVYEEARKFGVGQALMARMARIARDRGLGRLDLNVLTWNPARKFYERLGIAHIDEWVPYRVRGTALERLAALDTN
jgi:GNAT superfamily N-acetyltransferase